MFNLYVPYFVIKMGPLGSGKSYITPIIQNFIIDKDSYKKKKNLDFQDISIDTYVEADLDYINKTLDLADSLKNEYDLDFRKKSGTTNISNRDMIDFFDSKSNLFLKIYLDTRRKYDGELDNYLDKCILTGKNIYFETTGANSIDWLVDNTPLGEPHIRSKYTIILIYPFVDTNTILNRSMRRFITNLENYYNAPSRAEYIQSIMGSPINPPRYVKIYGDDGLASGIDKIQNYFADHIQTCFTKKSFIDYLLLIDNKSTTPIISIDYQCGKSNLAVSMCSHISEFINTNKNNLTEKLLETIASLHEKCIRYDNNSGEYDDLSI